MLSKIRRKHRTDEPRLIHLSEGRGILIHRTSYSIMGLCGPVDKWQMIERLTHYRYYSVTPAGIVRKIRQARS